MQERRGTRHGFTRIYTDKTGPLQARVTCSRGCGDLTAEHTEFKANTEYKPRKITEFTEEIPSRRILRRTQPDRNTELHREQTVRRAPLPG